ncbi:hypothetical protein EYF80_037065 [Liparis tanakae]|uniref:Uncharacterized protein n=1 Tax=Liparis tanakae TaxID=230148 RepID=A0A4Z2GHT4_9TELE|nr:hypothetical protein EYF80_037065 [Liparis tanakae]
MRPESFPSSTFRVGTGATRGTSKCCIGIMRGWVETAGMEEIHVTLHENGWKMSPGLRWTFPPASSSDMNRVEHGVPLSLCCSGVTPFQTILHAPLTRVGHAQPPPPATGEHWKHILAKHLDQTR